MSNFCASIFAAFCVLHRAQSWTSRDSEFWEFCWWIWISYRFCQCHVWTHLQFAPTFYEQLLCMQIPKVQRDRQVKQLFALSGSAHVKAVRKHIDEIDPRSPLLAPESNPTQRRLFTNAWIRWKLISGNLIILSSKQTTKTRISRQRFSFSSNRN